MKKVQLLCVGKIKEKYFSDGIAEYQKRLGKYCEFTTKQLPDYADNADAVKKESQAILSSMDGYTILLDIDGETVSSEGLAEIIESAYLTSPKVQVIIGGSHGVSAEVKAKASRRISFGRVTYPHNLMRLIAVEQIYRAFTITEGTSYHK